MSSAHKKVVILDRDGTINVERHYLSSPEEVQLLPGTAAGLRQMGALGYQLFVVTNQSGLGRGYFDLERLEQIHARLEQLLENEGVVLSGIYYCPHLPEDDCDCRKPKTGLVRRAARDHGFDPDAALVIGDKQCDIDLGHRVGAQTILVRTGYGKEQALLPEVSPHFIADDLKDAAQIIEQQLSINGGD